MSNKEIYVIKRGGIKEILNFEKINKVLLWATDNINGVSASDVAMNAQLQFYDGIKTTEIHNVLIRASADMISEKSPNYQYVAGNLLNYKIRKDVYGGDKIPSLYEIVKKNIDLGIYDPKFLEEYTEADFTKYDKLINHQRDFDFTYAGIQQLVDKYLLKDRKTNSLYETPQIAYMLIAMTVFGSVEEPKRYSLVRDAYYMFSKHKISLPTPIMAGVRTPNRQWSSCTLIDVADNLDSIFNSNSAVGYYTSKRAGIGLNMGSIRALGDVIRNGEVIHTGVIPFLRMFQSTTKSCTQNGIRGGSSTVHFPFWHKDIQDILVLKNNKGTDDNRVRHMDYSIQMNRLIYRRIVKNEMISLFSPNDVPDLYEAFFKSNDLFESLYEKYEKDESIDKKQIKSTDLINLLAQERIGTGRIYVMNIDHVNDHSAFLDPVKMSNLCLAPETVIDVKINYDGVEDILLLSKLIKKTKNEYIGSLTLEEVDSLYKKFYIDSYSEYDEENKSTKILLYTKGEIFIKSKDIESSEIEYRKLIGSMLTNESADLIKITDEDSGKFIECTEDHLIFTKNRGYIFAKDLNENDILDFN